MCPDYLMATTLQLINPALTRQVCTAVTEPRLPTAKWLAGESSVLWARSTRSWRVWLTSAAPTLSPKIPCGSAFWEAPIPLPRPKKKSRILPKWTVPNCTAAPRLTPHSAGTAQHPYGPLRVNLRCVSNLQNLNFNQAKYKYKKVNVKTELRARTSLAQ